MSITIKAITPAPIPEEMEMIVTGLMELAGAGEAQRRNRNGAADYRVSQSKL